MCVREREQITLEKNSREAAISNAGSPYRGGRALDTSAAAGCTDTPIPRTAGGGDRPTPTAP